PAVHLELHSFPTRRSSDLLSGWTDVFYRTSSYVISSVFLLLLGTGVLQPDTPQQPVFIKGIRENRPPNPTSNHAFAMIPCTIIMMPNAKRSTRIKFQFFK